MNLPQIIVIGLDGATWKLIRPLMSQGKLPFIKSLVGSGTSGRLTSPIPSVSATAWASFQTGTNPGKHGIFYFFHRRQNPSDPPLINSTTIKGLKLRDLLSQNNIKSLLINVPLSYPLQPINGIITSSFLTPKGATFCYPKNIESVLKKFNYKIDLQTDTPWDNLPHHQLNESETDDLIKTSKSIVTARINSFLYLYNQTNYKYCFLYFKSTDNLQHLLWGTAKLEQFWTWLDNQLAYMYQQIHDKKQYLFILSDHGFHSISPLQFSIYPWLNKNIMNISPQDSTEKPSRLRQLHHLVKKTGLDLTKIKFFKSKRDQIIHQIESSTLKTTHLTNHFLPTIEGLYLFDQLRNHLTIKVLVNKLKKVTINKYRVFKLIVPASEIYSGPFVDSGPDIVWQLSEQFSLDMSPLSREAFHSTTSHLKGEHFSDPHGLYIINGPGIKRGRFDANLIDIFPTICDIFRLQKPPGLDGTSLPLLHSTNSKNTQVDSSITASINI